MGLIIHHGTIYFARKIRFHPNAIDVHVPTLSQKHLPLSCIFIQSQDNNLVIKVYHPLLSWILIMNIHSNYHKTGTSLQLDSGMSERVNEWTFVWAPAIPQPNRGEGMAPKTAHRNEMLSACLRATVLWWYSEKSDLLITRGHPFIDISSPLFPTVCQRKSYGGVISTRVCQGLRPIGHSVSTVCPRLQRAEQPKFQSSLLTDEKSSRPCRMYSTVQ